MPRLGRRSLLGVRSRRRWRGSPLGAVVAGQFGGVARLGTRRCEMGLDAGAHARQVSQQPRVIAVVALARLAGDTRGAAGAGALPRSEGSRVGQECVSTCRYGWAPYQ